jgi:putative addiction module killer protein
MIVVLKSRTFDRWLSSLKDRQARARIQVRIDRLALGNPGDVEPVGSGISEMRIDYGPGYRVYYVQRGKRIAVLLCGGTKRTQDADIRRAKKMLSSGRRNEDDTQDGQQDDKTGEINAQRDLLSLRHG